MSAVGSMRCSRSQVAIRGSHAIPLVDWLPLYHRGLCTLRPSTLLALCHSGLACRLFDDHWLWELRCSVNGLREGKWQASGGVASLFRRIGLGWLLRRLVLKRGGANDWRSQLFSRGKRLHSRTFRSLFFRRFGLGFCRRRLRRIWRRGGWGYWLHRLQGRSHELLPSRCGRQCHADFRRAIRALFRPGSPACAVVSKTGAFDWALAHHACAAVVATTSNELAQDQAEHGQAPGNTNDFHNPP